MKTALLAILFLTLSFASTAQLCNGSLSDPIVSIDFGEAGSPNAQYGPALNAGITTYNYVNGIIGDGEYTIANSLQLGRPEWHNAPDRTAGDNGGYMFIVNASFATGEFYRTRVEGLCENTLFEFSAFAINALPPTICGNGIDPNLRFEIRATNGDLLASEESGPISETTQPTWEQYGVTFSTGSNTAVDVIIINNAPGGCGNDLAIDDIEFRACGDIASIEPSVTMGEICPNNVPQTINLQANLEGNVYTNPVYQWQEFLNGAWQDITGETMNNYTISPVEEGEQYRYLVAATQTNIENENCSVVSNSIEVTFAEEGNFSIEGETNYCQGDDLLLTVAGNNAIDLVEWSTPAGQLNGESYELTNVNASLSGEYFATITDEFGCIYEQSVTVSIQNNSSSTLSLTRCIGDVIELPNAEQYEVITSEQFDVTIPNAVGCDSIITINVTANPTYYEVVDTLACKNSQIVGPQGSLITLSESIELFYEYQSVNSCDSIVEKRISVPQDVFLTEQVCFGEELTLPTNEMITATESFSTTYNLPSSTACDSIIHFDVTVNPTYQTTDTIITCPIVPLELPGYGLVDQEGTYPVNFSSINQCDSTVNYTVIQEFERCDFEEICQLYYPNSITPNADNVNSSFKPLHYPACNYENYELVIWNRWGEEVFRSNNLFDDWLPTTNLGGVYIWTSNYEIVLQDGGTVSQSKSGTVLLLP